MAKIKTDRMMPDGGAIPTSYIPEDSSAKNVAKAKVTSVKVDDKSDDYYTKVLASGKTQAQIDALRNAYDTAEVIRQYSPTKTATVDRTTGKVVTTKKSVNGDGFSEPAPGATLVSTETDEYGNVIGFFSDGSKKIMVASGNKYKSTVDVDAYTLLETTFKEYGLEELVPEIKKFMEAGLGSNQAALELKKTNAYINRFRGNEIRRAAGLNVVSEAAYLELENSYNETLRAYGLQGYFGTDRKVAQAKMADIIGNDINAPEFKDRIDTVVTRVNNSDPNIKATLKAFYNIQDTDLVKYFLNPKENLPRLQEKVTSAEIGSEFIKQGLVSGVASAEEFAKLGIDKQQAATAARTISGFLPEAKFLSAISPEENINYSQQTAEEEVIKGLDSARRKRLKIAEKEIGRFSGEAGLARNALGSSKSNAF